MSRARARGFSLIEVLISLLIISILVGLLVPALIFARDSARTTVCGSNLRQIGGAWQLYISAHDTFPQHTTIPDWHYGGVIFRGLDRRPTLAANRPINAHLVDESEFDNEMIAQLFRCPSDRGIFPREQNPRLSASMLPGGANCFDYFGTSYRANPYLLDATLTGIDTRQRPLRMSEVQVSPSRLLIVGDPEWYYASRLPSDPDARRAATWHRTPGGGNFASLDGAVRFVRFGPGENAAAIYPRPELSPY